MKVRFVNFERINADRDGLDLVFFYDVDNIQKRRKIHTVAKLGAQIAWFMTNEEVLSYSMQMFPLVVTFLREYWEDNHALPSEDHEYFEGRELGYVRRNRIDWRGFELNLE